MLSNPRYPCVWQVRRSDGSYVNFVRAKGVREELCNVARLALNPIMLLLTPMFVSSNFFYTYQFNCVNGALFTVRYVHIAALLACSIEASTLFCTFERSRTYATPVSTMKKDVFKHPPQNKRAQLGAVLGRTDARSLSVWQVVPGLRIAISSKARHGRSCHCHGMLHVRVGPWSVPSSGYVHCYCALPCTKFLHVWISPWF